MQKKQQFKGGSNQNRGPRNGNRSGVYNRGNSRNKTGNRRKAYIDPSKFINKNVVQLEGKPQFDESVKFAEFGFNEAIQANLDRAGFTHPSEIQKKAIPVAMTGRDVIGLANTGTGKTIAFLMPILHQMMEQKTNNPAVLDLTSESGKSHAPRAKKSSALILAPTRELAQQIHEEFKKFGQKTGLYSALLVGGVNIQGQFRDLRRNPQIIIGTPGRVKDHLNRGSVNLNTVKFFVLDEADRMLDMGFVNDIRQIASDLPKERQTFCFSATFSAEVQKIAEELMNDAEMVSTSVNQTADHIYQDVVEFSGSADRKNQLISLLNKDEFEKVIIFGETKFGVQRLSDELEKSGISSRAIHGDKNQGQRNRVIRQFKNDEVDVLVATDVAARGLDIPNVSHVINYDIPQAYDDYIHRIGRTGRAGKSGTAYTFVPETKPQQSAKRPSDVRVGNNPRRPFKKSVPRMQGENSGKNYRANYNGKRSKRETSEG